MAEKMTRSQFLADVHQQYARWEALLAQAGRDRMEIPGAAGEMTVKDTIAHITWYEREMVEVLQAHALTGSDLWDLPLDQRNAAIFARYHDRALPEVLAEAQEVHQQLLAGLEALEELDLSDPARFPGMPSEWIPWEMMASNTSEHYREHSDSLLAWLQTR